MLTPKHQAESLPPPDRFRFRTGNLLLDEIAHIEAVAARGMADGIDPDSVKIGAFGLLKIAIEGVVFEWDGSAVVDPLPIRNPAPDSSSAAKSP